MLDYNVAIPYSLALINAALGLFILLGRKNISTQIFAIYVTFVSVWCVAIGLILQANTQSWNLAAANFNYVTAFGHVTLFLLFTKVFPKRRWDWAHITLASIPMIFIGIAVALNPNFILKEIGSLDHVIVQQPIYSYYILAVYIYVFWAFFTLYASYKKAKSGVEKRQTITIAVGTTTAYVIGGITNVIMPIFGQYEYIWIGPICAFFMTGSIAYAITKHQLFSVKVIATEFLTFALWLLLLIRATLSRDYGDALVNLIVLALVSVIGVLLIRSVIKEVETREKVELLAKELSAANAKLEALNRQKSEFVSIASHQLRTPLTAIKGYSSMLLEGSFGILEDKAKEAVSRVFESSERLVAIVEDFLNLSRIELGRMHYEFSSTDLKKMVREVCEELTQNATAKGISLSVAVPEGEPFMIWADAGKVRQVISNIVDNAIKYTKEGSVSVTLDTVKGNFRFRSTDTGIGLSKGDIARLFEKYVRTEEAKRTVAGGSGLGLFVANQIMKAHNSQIIVTSAGVHKGSTFEFTFAPDNGNHATISEETKTSILASDDDGKPTETVANVS